MLFRIFMSDGNDRWEDMRAKANDIDAVVEWLKTFFKPEYKDDLTVDVADETLAYIMWDECSKIECAKAQSIPEDETDDMCEDCEQPQYSYSVEAVEEPEAKDFAFKTIYGTNEYYDLTVDPPVKAQDWDRQLADAWRKDPQLGCDLLTLKTQIAIMKGEKFGDDEK